MDIYRILQKAMDRLYNFPETPENDAKKILEAFFSPIEAQVASCLHFLPQTPFYTWKILRKNFPDSTLGPKLVKTILEELDKRRLIYGKHILPRILGRQTYSMMPFAFGFFELSRKPTKEQLEKASDYIGTPEFSKAFHKRRQMQVIPINKRIITRSNAKLPFEEIEELIERAEKIMAIPCRCNEMQTALDPKHSCSLEESRKCLVFSYPGKGPRATEIYENNLLINKQQARELILELRKKGAVIQPENAQFPNFICICCSCCCQALGMAWRLGAPEKIGDYRAYIIPGRCEECGKCEKACPMDAITLSQGGAVINENLCIGCGLCAESCQSQAIRILRKFETKKPRDLFDSYIKSAFERFGRPKVLKMIIKNILGIPY